MTLVETIKNSSHNTPRVDLDAPFIQTNIQAGNLVLIKNFETAENCLNLIHEFTNWKKTYPPQSRDNPYPADIKNLHIPVEHGGNGQSQPDKRFPLDYQENLTPILVHNYRVGDLHAPLVDNIMPTLKKVGQEILNCYSAVSGPIVNTDPTIKRGLYFEAAHYAPGKGFIGKHTHLRNMLFGQKNNFLLMLSQAEKDFYGGELMFEKQDCVLSTYRHFNVGDLLIFPLDLVHWVTPVGSGRMAAQDEHPPLVGRWTMGLFYY